MRISSVLAPYLLRVYREGVGTALVRSGYGAGMVRVHELF